MGVTDNNLHWLNLLQVCCSLFQHVIILIMSLDTTNMELTERLYSLKCVEVLQNLSWPTFALLEEAMQLLQDAAL